jgi:quercetin dioxygenase-like cupin family protein
VPGTGAAIGEEHIYVTRGRGELRTDSEPVASAPGDALFVPPGVWHWVANTGDEDVEMVYSFPSLHYPPTERR